MAKKEGMTAGAIVLAGVLLHPFAGNSPQIESTLPSATSPSGSSSLSQANLTSGEGPWTASCHYWAPARKSEPDDELPAAAITHEFKANREQYSVRKQREPGCAGSNNPWGIPTADEMPVSAKISAVIAIVPDPLHAHAALDFDRTIDALLQAASDNGYVESYYWLPWNKPEEDAKEASNWELDSRSERHERQRKPGLIVLKRVPLEVPADSKEPGKNEPDGDYFSDVVYLFLVGGTAVQGVYGSQLENALKYEGELQCMSGKFLGSPVSPPRCTAVKQPPETGYFNFQVSPTEKNTLAIIGPNNTGEAASLWAELQRSAGYVDHSRIVISGQTSSPLASEELSQGTDPAKPTYTSFRAESLFTEKKLVELVNMSGHPQSSIALLIEDSTSLGQSLANRKAKPDKSSAEPPPSRRDAPVKIRFPRGISLLRNAHRDSGAAAGGENASAPSPFLRLSLRDTSVEDTVTHFSPEQTPLSQEAELMAIVRQLRRYRTKFVAITATDDLDEIFLAEFLHRTLPDVRLVSLGGGDLLYERDSENDPFVGGLTLSAYNLVAPVPSYFASDASFRPFSSEGAEAVYNSASYIFWSGIDEPRLANYRNIFNPHEPLIHPSMWLTAIGRDGYAVLGKVANCASVSTSSLPAFQTSPVASASFSLPLFDSARKKCDEKEVINQSGNRIHEIIATLAPPSNQDEAWRAKEEREPSRFPLNPALSWLVLCVLSSALCLAHIVCLSCANIWSPVTRDLAIDQNDEPCRRALYIHIGAVMLFCTAWVIVYPLFAALPLIKPSPTSIYIALFTLVCGLLCLATSMVHIWPHTFGTKQPLRPWNARYRAKQLFKGNGRRYRLFKAYTRYKKNREGGLTADFRALGFFHVLAFLATLVVPVVWAFICERNWSGDTQSFVGLFFSYRCLNPLSGVSPLLPLVLLLLGWFVWSTMQTRRLRFSSNSRPRLPQRTPGGSLYRLYVADGDIAEYNNGLSSALFRNMSCLLITRELFSRHFFKKDPEIELKPIDPEKVESRAQQDGISEPDARAKLEKEQKKSVGTEARKRERNRQRRIGWFLLALYSAVCILVVRFVKAESLEHILFKVGPYPTFYETLLKMLLFPLMMVTIAGWVRMTLVWNALRSGVLLQLESLPIRSAFNRTRRDGWMSMMRQSGLEERWREMSRSLESMRQMAHDNGLEDASPKPGWLLPEPTLAMFYNDLHSHVEDLLEWITYKKHRKNYAIGHEEVIREFRKVRDRPDRKHESELLLMYLIESEYANFATRLLERVLVPYWTFKRTGMVETEEPVTIPVHARKSSESGEYSQMELHAGPAGEVPLHIQVAEEFVVIRYISLIRAVLVNLRQIMTFVSCAFALTLVAWNSYPFRPREWIDAAFTGLLILLMGGIVWVFAQMHRDPILNRITKTEASELGADFYLRVAAFGAAPLLTWLAYQFPTIGNAIVKFAQPGLEVIK